MATGRAVGHAPGRVGRPALGRRGLGSRHRASSGDTSYGRLHRAGERPNTEKGRRTFALDPETAAALKAWRLTQAQERLRVGPAWQITGYVFTNPDGSPIHPQRFSDWFQQHCRKAMLPRIRLHDVRHSYATAGLAAGVPLKAMSARLGHANTAITADLYQHVLPAMDEAAALQVAAVIDG